MEIRPGFVEEMRHSLLDLHKALLDAQQIRYEREHGRIKSAGELLGLVLEHPAFAWLRSLSALIARLDEWLEAKEEAGNEDLAAMIQALRTLIESGGKDLGFNKPYWEIANEVPEVLVAHVKLWRLIQPAAAGADPRRPADRPRG
jgi:hypothetical protein